MGNTHKCPTCKGHGEVFGGDSYIRGGWQCPTCKGKGKTGNKIPSKKETKERQEANPNETQYYQIWKKRGGGFTGGNYYWVALTTDGIEHSEAKPGGSKFDTYMEAKIHIETLEGILNKENKENKL